LHREKKRSKKEWNENKMRKDSRGKADRTNLTEHAMECEMREGQVRFRQEMRGQREREERENERERKDEDKLINDAFLQVCV
jgi:hypothetical protein